MMPSTSSVGAGASDKTKTFSFPRERLKTLVLTFAAAASVEARSGPSAEWRTPRRVGSRQHPEHSQEKTFISLE